MYETNRNAIRRQTMNNEIEVGEYVRTKSGIIIKADFIDFERLTISQKGLGWDFEDVEEMEDFIENEIVKHSKIKSEIVEVGDYVNGKLIHKIDKGTNYCYLYYGNCKTFVDYQIKSIVTKEAFKEIEYVF